MRGVRHYLRDSLQLVEITRQASHLLHIYPATVILVIQPEIFPPSIQKRDSHLNIQLIFSSLLPLTAILTANMNS